MGVVFPWLVFVWTLGAWACLWVVDNSCVFVFLTGSFVDELGNPLSSSTREPPRIERGTQRGQWFPTDSCQVWNRQLNDEETEDVSLDAKMVLTRVAAGASVGLGALVWLYVTIMAISITRAKRKYTSTSTSQHSTTSNSATGAADHDKDPSMLSNCWKGIIYSSWVQHLFIFVSVVISACQAVTHLMVKSDFCEDADPLTVVFDNGQIAIYDTCEKDTPAYNLTFATMALWMLTAISVGCLPYPANTSPAPEPPPQENEHENMDDIPEAQVMEIVQLGPGEEGGAANEENSNRNEAIPSEAAAAAPDSFHEEDHADITKEEVIIDGA